MRAAGRDRWLPVLLSVLVHGAILAALGWGWWTYRKPPQIMHTLAIQGTVVNSGNPRPVAVQPVKAPEPVPEPAPAPVAAAPAQPAPPAPAAAPDPARLRAEQQAAAKAALERQAVAQRAEEQASAQREARKRAEAEAAQAAQAARLEAEKQAKAEADRQAKAAADKRAAAEKQALQNEINAQLEAEKRLNAARDSGQQDQYVAMIKNHIERQWIRPPGTPQAMDCVADVRQVPGGEVTGVSFYSCDASAAIKQSVEDAIYRASPLPAPPTPDLFEAVLRIHFHGSD
jgi:colicin import membrane protein